MPWRDYSGTDPASAVSRATEVGTGGMKASSNEKRNLGPNRESSPFRELHLIRLFCCGNALLKFSRLPKLGDHDRTRTEIICRLTIWFNQFAPLCQFGTSPDNRLSVNSLEPQRSWPSQSFYWSIRAGKAEFHRLRDVQPYKTIYATFTSTDKRFFSQHCQRHCAIHCFV